MNKFRMALRSNNKNTYSPKKYKYKRKLLIEIYIYKKKAQPQQGRLKGRYVVRYLFGMIFLSFVIDVIVDNSSEWGESLKNRTQMGKCGGRKGRKDFSKFKVPLFFFSNINE